MNLEDSPCIKCALFRVEGRYYRETLESPAEYPEPYCEIEEENFGTSGGCWNWKGRCRYDD